MGEGRKIALFVVFVGCFAPMCSLYCYFGCLYCLSVNFIGLLTCTNKEEFTYTNTFQAMSRFRESRGVTYYFLVPDVERCEP